MLDIGFGGGDISRRIAAWAARDGIAFDDYCDRPRSKSTRVCERQTGRRESSSFARPQAPHSSRRGARFDVVISNHVLHHLDEGLGRIPRRKRAARVAARRSRRRRTRRIEAYIAFSIFALPVGRALLCARRRTDLDSTAVTRATNWRSWPQRTGAWSAPNHLACYSVMPPPGVRERTRRNT